MVKKKQKEDRSGLFIPAGIFLGLGFGFLYNNLVAGLFIGLGAGFVLTAVAQNIVKN
jgi:hypothetical protein